MCQPNRPLHVMVKNWLRNLFYPGLDLHTRNRSTLCRFWKSGHRDVLDAGSGNGWFSWLAYRSGARVVALNSERSQVFKARDLLLRQRQADPDRLRFEEYNLYDLKLETRRFDEIICYEVLEHIRNDVEILRELYRVLRPGGVLHLCCPYRLHPRHMSELLDTNEQGGHVRSGYTAEDYKNILEPIGFEIGRIVGIGSPILYHADRFLRAVRNHIGDWLALLIFPCTLPALWWGRRDPDVPFSIYVQALKKEIDSE